MEVQNINTDHRFRESGLSFCSHPPRLRWVHLAVQAVFTHGAHDMNQAAMGSPVFPEWNHQHGQDIESWSTAFAHQEWWVKIFILRESSVVNGFILEFGRRAIKPGNNGCYEVVEIERKEITSERAARWRADKLKKEFLSEAIASLTGS